MNFLERRAREFQPQLNFRTARLFPDPQMLQLASRIDGCQVRQPITVLRRLFVSAEQFGPGQPGLKMKSGCASIFPDGGEFVLALHHTDRHVDQAKPILNLRLEFPIEIPLAHTHFENTRRPGEHRLHNTE